MRKHHSGRVQTIIVPKSLAPTLAQARAVAKSHHAEHLEVDETSQSYRFRQRDPSQFVPGSFRTYHTDDGVAIVVGTRTDKEPARNPGGEERARHLGIQDARWAAKRTNILDRARAMAASSEGWESGWRPGDALRAMVPDRDWPPALFARYGAAMRKLGTASGWKSPRAAVEGPRRAAYNRALFGELRRLLGEPARNPGQRPERNPSTERIAHAARTDARKAVARLLPGVLELLGRDPPPQPSLVAYHVLSRAAEITRARMRSFWPRPLRLKEDAAPFPMAEDYVDERAVEAREAQWKEYMRLLERDVQGLVTAALGRRAAPARNPGQRPERNHDPGRLAALVAGAARSVHSLAR
jgi:hypothetical protein